MFSLVWVMIVKFVMEGGQGGSRLKGWGVKKELTDVVELQH